MQNTSTDNGNIIPSTPVPQATSTVKRENPLVDITVSRMPEEAISPERGDSSLQENFNAISKMREKLSEFFSLGDNSIQFNDFKPDIKYKSQLLTTQEENVRSNLPQLNVTGESLQMVKKVNETSEETFSQLLSVSDLDRDEMYCIQKWNALPAPEYDISVTGVDNSKITPPCFMPMEDSLFNNTNFGGAEKSTLCHAKSHITGKEEKILIKDISVASAITENIPSINDISLAMRSCDLNANPEILMEEVLKAGKEATNKDPKGPNKPLSKPDTASYLEAPLTLPPNLYDAFGNLSFNQRKTSSSQFHMSSPSYFKPGRIIISEEMLVWGSVALGSSVNRILYIINSNPERVRFHFLLKAPGCFKIFQNIADKYIGQEAWAHLDEPGAYKLVIMFLPRENGPAIGHLKISNDCGEEKTVVLNAFGGRSDIIISPIAWNITRGQPSLMFDTPELTTNITLENLGTANGFFFLSTDFNDIFGCEPSCGVLLPTEKVCITVRIKKETKALNFLLSQFSGSTLFTGNLSIYYGEEAARQRIRKICRVFQRSVIFGNPIDDKYSFLMTQNLDKPCFVGKLADDPNSLRYLRVDGIQETNVSIQVKRKVIEEVSTEKAYPFQIPDSSITLMLFNKDLLLSPVTRKNP